MKQSNYIIEAWEADRVALAVAVDGKHKGEYMLIDSLTRSIEWTDSNGKVTLYTLDEITEKEVYYFSEI